MKLRPRVYISSHLILSSDQLPVTVMAFSSPALSAKCSALLPRLIQPLQSQVFREIVQLGVVSLHNETISAQRFREIQSQTALSPHDFGVLFNAMIVLLRNLMRLPLDPSKHEKYHKELITGLRIPEEKSAILLDIVVSSKSQVMRGVVMPSSPSIRSVEWRFGVISRRSEGMEPGILLRIDTTAGLFCLRVGLKTFHKLRFAVAKAFGELTILHDKVLSN